MYIDANAEENASNRFLVFDCAEDMGNCETRSSLWYKSSLCVILCVVVLFSALGVDVELFRKILRTQRLTSKPPFLPPLFARRRRRDM
jgi:hypothetical protein